MSAINTITPLYNPKLKTRDQLVNEFVVRLKIFDNIFEDIKKSKMIHPEQHYLLIGQRGAGKTTLLERLRYAIEDDIKLNKRLIPIALNEEQYNVSELANLWETIAETLEDYHNIPGILEEMQTRLHNKNYEEYFFVTLINYLDTHKKKLVLFIDNLGDILAKFSETDVKRLREILMTSSHIRIVAGSPVVLDGLFDYHNPLMEFFNIIYLKSLDRAEVEKLLFRLAKLYQKEEIINKVINETPERIEVLRRLTGGVPRTIVMLFNIFVDNQDGKALKDFITVIDQATPLYKHNMDDLPIQQQKIVDAVAKAWDGVSVKDIKEKVRMESKNISTQLKLLERNQLIVKRKLPEAKNYIYMLQDRFFNIWYLMRHGRRYDKKRVEWLVRFFEAWLDKSELETRVKAHIENLEKGTYDPHAAVLMFETYKQCNVDFLSKIILFNKTKGMLPEEMKKYISISDLEILNEINKELTNEQFENAIEIGKLHPQNSDVLYAIAISLYFLGRYIECEKYFIKSLEIKRSPLVLLNLGILYAQRLNELEKAKEYIIEGLSSEVDKKSNLRENDRLFEPQNININIHEIVQIALEELDRINVLNPNININIGNSTLLFLAENGFKHAYVLLGNSAYDNNPLSEALSYYDKAVSAGSTYPPMIMLYLEILILNNFGSKKAKILFDTLNKIENQWINTPLKEYGIILESRYLLWNDEFEASLEIFTSVLLSDFQDNVVYNKVKEYLLFLVSKNQYNSAFKLFQNKDFKLIDMFSPIYYALIEQMGNDSELLKMGDELTETVGEVIHEIIVLRERYKTPPIEEEAFRN